MDSFLTEQVNNQIYLRKKSDAISGAKVATKDTIMKVYHEFMLHIHTVTLITFEKSNTNIFEGKKIFLFSNF